MRRQGKGGLRKEKAKRRAEQRHKQLVMFPGLQVAGPNSISTPPAGDELHDAQETLAGCQSSPNLQDHTNATTGKRPRHEKGNGQSRDASLKHGIESDGDTASSPGPDDEELLYKMKDHGTKNARPVPVAKNLLHWASLPQHDFALLRDEGNVLRIDKNDVVLVGPDDGDAAFVEDIREITGDRYLLLLVWFYTKEDIRKEMNLSPSVIHGSVWALEGASKYMLSTNREVHLWDTIKAKAPQKVTTELYCDHVYMTNRRERKVCKIKDPRVQWMKPLLDLARMKS